MANVTASMVKELREKTGAGMMDCKKALQECDGNMDKAIDYLREKGIADSAKKSGRIAAEGVVASYIHISLCTLLLKIQNTSPVTKCHRLNSITNVKS